MKKRIVLAAFVACFSLSTTIAAGEWATGSGSCYARGDKYLDIGIPVPMYPLGVHCAFDYGFHDAISGGGGVGLRYYYGTSPLYFTFLGRAAFHPFNLKVWADKIKVRDKLDVWVGPTAWFAPAINGWPEWGVREYLGARWHFTPKIGVFLEDCGGFGYIDGGLTIQL